jgi:putative membrane-bound dehydrogenase-like protein
MPRSWRTLAGLSLVLAASLLRAEAPVCTDPRLVIELVAKEPDIVTPTGIAVDERGRIWVIENNTHQRPESYKGPSSDRVRIFTCDADGRARRAITFAEGFRDAMSLAFGKNGAVYLATRSAIYLLRDTKGEGRADERKVIAKLDTTATYPHNGLSGFAFDELGNLYFSLGENLGAPYKLIGSDGSACSGGGEGGSIYRCRPDGSELVRIATGFWNTFHLTFDVFGRLFAVDNDPDSRGPCRLLHIIPGGDYGYRYRNGRKGLHPFTAWNGELPGTLPMVAGTGEAPCGIVAYESTGLPSEYRGTLLVTSWGDHVVERFKLKARGASFVSQAETIVRGGEDFRPVGIVTAPDGSLYFSDWVDKSYPVHGKGRIWRLRMKEPPPDDGLRASRVAAPSDSKERLLRHLKREIRAAAAEALAEAFRARKRAGRIMFNDSGGLVLLAATSNEDSRARMAALVALAKMDSPAAAELLSLQADLAAPELRAAAVRLLGETPSFPERRNVDLAEVALKDPSPSVRLEALLQMKSRSKLQRIVPCLADSDPFLAAAVLAILGRSDNTSLLLPYATAENAKLRLGVLLALRRGDNPEGRKILPRFLSDPDPTIRGAAIQWVAEERLQEFSPLLTASASQSPVSRDLFEALLAAKELLAGVRRLPSDEPSGEAFVSKVLTDSSQPAEFRALALRMLRPDHPAVSAGKLRQFLFGNDNALRWEAARTLAMRSDEDSQRLLRELAADPRAENDLRLEAILGLAHSARASPGTRKMLLAMLSVPALRQDALRSLRGSVDDAATQEAICQCWDKSLANGQESPELGWQIALAMYPRSDEMHEAQRAKIAKQAGPRPRGEAQWRVALAGKGDPLAGERVFFHPRGPRCFACHRVDGRGGQLGPDLSATGRSLSRDKLIESILLPSKEIAPQYTSWLIATRDGKVRTGVIVDEGPNSTITLGDNQGNLEIIHRLAVTERHAVTTSIMPDNLQDLMTPREFADLLAFLCARK